MIGYMPTLHGNSVSFNQMNDPPKQFLPSEVGNHWMDFSGWVISLVSNGILSTTSRECCQYLPVVSIVSAVMAFQFYIAAPPSGKGEKVTLRDILGLDAIKLLKDGNFLIFFISSVLICIPLAFYYSNISPF